MNDELFDYDIGRYGEKRTTFNIDLEPMIELIRNNLNLITKGFWSTDVDGWPIRAVLDENNFDGDYRIWDKSTKERVIAIKNGFLKKEDEPNNPYFPMVICFDTLNFIASSKLYIEILLDEIDKLKLELPRA